jgi:hypothetical protein
MRYLCCKRYTVPAFSNEHITRFSAKRNDLGATLVGRLSGGSGRRAWRLLNDWDHEPPFEVARQ